MNLEQLLQLKFPDIEYTATPRDAMLYALGIGVGDRPEDARDLQFVYEQNLKMFPSQVNVICHPGGWIMNPVLQVDWVKRNLCRQLSRAWRGGQRRRQRCATFSA